MARSSSQALALSAKEVVLGLVVERPGSSGELERRLQVRFGSARFAHGAVHQAVKQLLREGLICAVEDSRSSAGQAPVRALHEGRGDVSRLSGYEATSAGAAHFESWLGAGIGAPAVRESLHAKIAFCSPGDLPRMVELVREAEAVCLAQLEEAGQRHRRERRLGGEDEWRQIKNIVVATGDAMWWEARLKWLQGLRVYLSREAQRYAPR